MTPPYPCLGAIPDGNCPQTPTYQARECTSGASWWGSQYQGKPWPTGWGNAMNWPAAARKAGFTVNTTPAIYSIMCLGPNVNGAGPVGHVAYVVGPVVQGHAEVFEMDFRIRFGFDFRPALVTGCEYIHLTPKPVPPAPPIGVEDMPWLYQAANGTIYLVCGGSRLALSAIADVQAFQAKGAQLILASSLTVNGNSEVAKLPVL